MAARRLFCLLLVCLVAGVHAQPGALPRPASLEPAVRFWSRVFSEVDTHGGLLHDALKRRISESIKRHASARHVPNEIFAVREIPRTLTAT